MSDDIRELARGNYLALRIVNGWEYMHEHASPESVAIMVFRNNSETPLLASIDTIPCHFMNGEPTEDICTFTGLMEKDEKPIITACRELEEETGYRVNAEEMLSLGFVFPMKSADMKTHLFAIDVTNKERFEAVGDGSEKEANMTTEWISMNDALLSADPLFAVMIARTNLVLQAIKEQRAKQKAAQTQSDNEVN